MGKNPSRPSRHTRRKQQRLDRGFTLTVGAAPTSRRTSGAVALHNELRLVRSSLLYADQVDLIAPAALAYTLLIKMYCEMKLGKGTVHLGSTKKCYQFEML